MSWKAESICGWEGGRVSDVSLEMVDLGMRVFGIEGLMGMEERHTSCNSTSGGPSAMSSALVPGRIRRDAPVS